MSKKILNGVYIMLSNPVFSAVTRAMFISLLFFSGVAQANVYFSEYIEGSLNNKALEIFNNSATALDLSGYEVQVYFNGSSSAGLTIPLQGAIAAGDVFVVAHSQADPAILAVADQTTGAGLFNGDDAVVLLYGGSPVDIIGQIGVDPGSQWGMDDSATANRTLRRKSGVTRGDNDGTDVFDPTIEWDGFAQDTFVDLGIYRANESPSPTPTLTTTPTVTPSPSPSLVNLVINEFDSDTVGTDTLEFIEIYDGGQGNVALDGYSIVLYNGSNDLSYRTIDLSGYRTNAEGYFVVGNETVANVILVIPANSVQNGADAIALYRSDILLPLNSPLTLNNLVDAVVYGTSDATDLELLALLNSGELQIDENSGGVADSVSNQRCGNGAGELRNTSSYVQALPSPGAANTCTPVPLDQCGAPATKIHNIQGEGLSSPLSGSVHSIEGIVVGDFQGSEQLNGFFVQEEDVDNDTKPLTSEGIFVFDSASNTVVNPGDLVRITGTVSEYFDMTQITATRVQICATGQNVTATELTLPLDTLGELEALEGMSVTISQDLTVSENYNLGRFGELILSANGRMMIPTQVALPGDEARSLAASNRLRRIVLDDGSNRQNPAVIPYPAPELSAFNTVRAGDTVTNLRGVLHYSFNEYRIQPTITPVFVANNLRTSTPDLPDIGSLKIASFNVLNYFNGDGLGGGFPTSRGANSLLEFERQREKIISALMAMDADVVGLIEIENDGYGELSAIQDLVNGLRDSGLDYAVVNPGVDKIGSDEIAVGFIYKPSTVELVNTAVILDRAVDARFIDTKNRPVLAQTFREISTRAALTVAVAHLKSKGSDCNDVNDPDTADGQGNCNLTRTSAAQALTEWLTTDPTQSLQSKSLIIGDLNSYAKEDPIRVIEAAGYVNLLQDKIGDQAYSYVFSGESGYLDHALTNAELYGFVSGVTEWHINADEPRALDYNMEFKTPEQVISLYGAESYRSSDHDPLLIELNFQPEPEKLAGDFNGNQRLDGQDFTLLLHQLRKPVTEANALFDLNNDNRINLWDVVCWSRLFADSQR